MRATSETAAEIKNHVSETMRLLRQLRDEVRVELHLAGMEAQERFRAFEPRLAHAEQLASDVSESTMSLLNGTLSELKAFKAKLVAARQVGKPAPDLSKVLPPFA